MVSGLHNGRTYVLLVHYNSRSRVVHNMQIMFYPSMEPGEVLPHWIGDRLPLSWDKLEDNEDLLLDAGL